MSNPSQQDDVFLSVKPTSGQEHSQNSSGFQQLSFQNHAYAINGAPRSSSQKNLTQQQEEISEQTATQIHFNFGLMPPQMQSQNQNQALLRSSDGQGVGASGQTSRTQRIETPSKIDNTSLKYQMSPNDEGVGFNGLVVEEEIEDPQLRSSETQKMSSPEGTGVGTSPMTIKNKTNKRDKRWSQQQVLEIPSSSESSPGSPVFTKIEMQNETVIPQSKFFNDEVQMHRDAYEKVSRFYPPNPILPKSFLVHDDSPRSGGEFAYIKLLKFRGKDLGKSKFEIEKGVNQIEFPEGVTLKSIFAPPPDSTDDRITAYGELVYTRYALDFSVKNHQAGNKKDEVLEENLLDVRRILKNSNTQAGQGAAGQANNMKKGLINLQGVDTFYKKKDQFDKTLIFESRFESGNLAAALKVSDTDYHLLLQNDVNTSGHTQWYFFRVQNTRKYTQTRFNILNLSKPDSLYNEGMKVLVYSEKLSEDKDIGWHRSCQKISYYHNGIKKDNQKKQGNAKTLYTHTFTYEFQYDDDTVYFAYCYPYTYTDLLDDLSKISSDPNKSQHCSRRTLCMSLAGNKVEMLTITSKNNLENLNKRKGVFLTARVHPGESVGSWMMKGAIDFLTDENSEEAEYLRQNFVFKVIPMLNPDGVINGNYRCSLAGCDLNRRWKAPSKVLHPCIYYTKQLLQQFAKERELVVFCDFHGHSRRKNIFMYGCHNPQSPEETRLYPYLMSKICPFFSFGYSRFGNQKSKEATARIAMFNEVKIPAIYTMESSFCGMDEGPYANYHFSTDNLMQTGRDFCRTLLLFSQISIPQNLCQNILQQVMSLLDYSKQQNDMKDLFNKDSEVEAMKIFTEKIRFLQQEKKDITTKRLRKALLQVLRSTHDVATDGESSSSAGSDKAPSEDNLEPEEMQMVVPNLEDEAALSKKNKKGAAGGKKDLLAVPQPGGQDMTTSISPIRRKGTIQEQANANSLKKGNTKPGPKQPNKPGLKKEKNDSKTNLKATLDEGSEKKPEDGNDEEQKFEEQIQQNDQEDTVTHKKKRKRNVESRDAWTQTDRSDYMLIKYRQKQKLALQMAKSQKFSKEEQMLYEQALQFHKAQQQLLNKTQQDIMPAQNQVTSHTGSMTQMNNKVQQQYAYGANAARVLQQQSMLSSNTAGPTTSIGPVQSQPNSVNVSRNLSSAQAATKKQKGIGGVVTGSGGQILGVTGKSQQMYAGGLANQTAGAAVSKANQPTEAQLRQSSGTQNAFTNSLLNQNNTSGLPSIQPNQGSTINSKRKTIQGTNQGNIQTSPNKKGLVAQGQEVMLNNAFIQMQQMAAGQIPQSDMSSSHSTQRIVNPKINYPQTSMTIDNPVVAAAMMHQANNMLVVVPQQSKGAQSVPSRKPTNPMNQNSMQQQSVPQNMQDINKLMFQVEMVNATPVLENAYIQKRLLQQMQMQQQQQFEQQMDKAEYGSLRANNPKTSMTIGTKPQLQKAGELEPWVVQQPSPQFINQPQSTAVPGHRGRKTVSTKNPNSQSMQGPPSFQGQPGSQQYINFQNQNAQQNLFANSQIPLAQNQLNSPFKNVITTQNTTTTGSGGVKISIVNVHNQFNIHNNIIINNGGGANQNQMSNNASMPGQTFFGQSVQPSSNPTKGQQHQFQHMNSGPVTIGGIVGGIQNTSFYTVNNTSKIIGSSGSGVPKQQPSYQSPTKKK